MKIKKMLSYTVSFILLVSAVTSAAGCNNEKNIDKSYENSSSVSSKTVTEKPSEKEPIAESKISETYESSVSSENPDIINDNGIFSENYGKAYKIMKQMSLDEKIGQMFYAHCPDDDGVETAQKYHLGGYVLFGKDFEDKTKEEVKKEMQSYVFSHNIPMSLSVDEEGGSVTRISAKPDLSDHEFKSPRELYAEGGMELIKSDTEEKAQLLEELSIDTNLAPVCDISVNESDFMYDRSIGLDADGTGEFVKNVTEISQKNGVSVTLKHFPGYGNNKDTHTGIAVDDRSYETFENNDFKPFEAGINSGAHLILVSHNIVNCIDDKMPASISPKIHDILRNKLNFTGIIVTDDLEMDAIKDYIGDNSPAVSAVLAGNDMLIVNDVETSFNDIKSAVKNGTIDENIIDKAVVRILAWKYTKGLIKQ